MNLWEPILAMIMALTSFAIKPNPKAPTAEVVLEHTVDDADVFVHLDLTPTVIDNYAVWQKLVDEPLVKQMPALRDGLRDASTQAEGGRAMVKSLIGVDLAADLTSITAYAKFKPSGPPDVLVVVRGAIAADLPQRLSQNMGGKPETIDGRVAATTSDGMMIGTAKSGALLVGTRAWVAPRLADGWKAAPRARGSAWAHIATALTPKPFFVLASKPSSSAAAQLATQIPASFGRELVTQHTLAIVTASATGIGWTYQAKDAAFAARIKLASEGWIELMRAAHIAPRGMAELAVAALPSYAGRGAALDDAIKHKDQILAAVGELTGDGKFQATVKQSGTLVTVTTRGRRISDVVPVGLVMGLGALGWVSATAPAPAPATVPARPTPRPTTVRPPPTRSTTPRPAPKPSAGSAHP
ncbi:MAG: hypothetical protein IPL61_21615 [Myxococcales bacterium]|nr:hypothetical protein [Myxococcales bacterium]